MGEWEQPPHISKKNDFSLLHVARFILGGMGIIYMFGQLFFSTFSYVSTGVAISGFVVAYLSGNQSEEDRSTYILVLLCCAFGVSGIGYDIYEYYSNYQIPGNNYPLTISIVFIVAFIVAAIYRVITKNA